MSADIVQRSQQFAMFPDIKDATLDLYRLVRGAYGKAGSITIANALFVAKNGNDATAAPNNLGKPYATIGAALAAATSGDVVFIEPGTYIESITVPPTLAKISLQATSITGVSVIGTLTWQPTVPGAILGLGNLQIAPALAGTAITIDASGSLGYPSGPVLFGSDLVIGSFDIRALQSLELTNVKVFNALANNIKNVANGSLTNVQAFGDLTLEWDQATAIGSRSPIEITGSSFANFIPKGEPSVIVQSSTFSGGVVPTGLLTYKSGPNDLAPDIQVQASTIKGAVAITFAPLQPAQTARNTASFVGCRIDGASSVAVSAPDALNRARVAFAGCKMNNSVQAGQSTDIDLRGSTYDAITAVADGAIDRLIVQLVAIAVPAGPVAVPITPPFPASVGSSYGVSYMSVGAGAVVVLGAQTPSQLTVAGGPDTVDLVLSRPSGIPGSSLSLPQPQSGRRAIDATRGPSAIRSGRPTTIPRMSYQSSESRMVSPRRNASSGSVFTAFRSAARADA